MQHAVAYGAKGQCFIPSITVSIYVEYGTNLSKKSRKGKWIKLRKKYIKKDKTEKKKTYLVIQI